MAERESVLCVQVQDVVLPHSDPHYSSYWLFEQTFRWIKDPFLDLGLLSTGIFSHAHDGVFDDRRNTLKAAGNKHFVLFFPLTYSLTFLPSAKTNGNHGEQKGGGKKRAEKLTFSLNGGGMGRGDAAVTMQQRLWLFLSLPFALKQDLWPYEYHHILATHVHHGWFILDWGLFCGAYQRGASMTYNTRQEVTKRTPC